MRRSTIFLSTAAVLVLSAGLVAGRLSARLPVVAPAVVSHPPTTSPANHGRGWFPDELGLTPEQDKSMKAIWEDARAQMGKDQEKRKALEHDRDIAIKTLLTPEQSAKYDKIFEDYHAGRAELDKDHDKLMRAASEKSRALLTPEQQAKWDAMSRDMHHGPGGPGGPVGGRHGGAASQPGEATPNGPPGGPRNGAGPT